MSDADHAAASDDGCHCLEAFRRIESYVWFALVFLGVLGAIALVVRESLQAVNT